jgi:hypothetical protein
MNWFIFQEESSMIDGLVFWLCIGVGGLSAGESTLLAIGMRDAAGPTPWMTPANIAYVASDIALGAGLVAAEVLGRDRAWYGLAALGALALTNGARAIEYLLHVPDAFCANGGLFAVDCVKLALCLAGGVLLLMAR